jgi:8-oxo-dGTP pyrophosphatase MutT (NUDIX family)
MSMANEKSSGVIIFREHGPERLYLLLHYEEGHWEFPKGHIERGEVEQKTALREAKEETGISDLELVFGFKDKLEYSYERDGKKMHKKVIFFLGQTHTSEVKLSDEHVNFEWLPYDKAYKRLTYPNAKELLVKAETFLQKHL